MSKIFGRRYTFFEITLALISLIAGGITISQNLGFLSVAQGSIIESPVGSYVMLLAFLLVLLSLAVLNKAGRRR